MVKSLHNIHAIYYKVTDIYTFAVKLLPFSRGRRKIMSDNNYYYSKIPNE